MTDEQQQQLQWAVKGRHRIADMTGHLHGIPNRDDGEEPLMTRDSGGNYRLATVSPRAGARTEWRWFYDIDRLADFLTSQSMITTTIQGG